MEDINVERFSESPHADDQRRVLQETRWWLLRFIKCARGLHKDERRFPFTRIPGVNFSDGCFWLCFFSSTAISGIKRMP